MIDRDVGCTLMEIINRVAALTHHLGEKSVRVVQCSRWVVDECCLNLAPALAVRLQRIVRQRANIELVSLALAGDQFLFRCRLFADIGKGSLVLRTELLLETVGPLTSA